MKIVEIKKGAENQIIVIFPYNSIYVERIKSIKERRWYSGDKYWSFLDSSDINELSAMPCVRKILE